MNDTTTEVLAAIAGIVILEAFALHAGIDGIALGACIATIAALGGYRVATLAAPSANP